MPDPPRPSRWFIPSAFFTNLDAPIPLPRKVYLLTRNLSLRVIQRSTCCGHDGEPGC